LTVQQLIGGITQQNFFIIISPTHILRQQWPGGFTPPVTGSIQAATDARLPRVNDKLYVRGAQKNVDQVAPIFDGGQCIRIELKVIG